MEQEYKRTTEPRSRRMDILPYLRRGQQRDIATRLKCHPGTVSNVLNGKQAQNSDLARNIIRVAEDCVRLNHRFNNYRYGRH